MSLKLHFLRHGQTASSRDNDFCGSGTDAPLTAEGEEMAQAFADHYHGTMWHAIYSSPQRRALATVRPLCEALGIEPEVRDGLKEIGYGAWEGMTLEGVRRQHGKDYGQWLGDPAWHAPTNGESAAAVSRRVLEVIEEICHSHADGNVLVVSHKATIRIALCNLLGIDISSYRFRLGCPVGSVSVVEFGARGPLLRALADRSHLEDRLRDLPGT
jgi:broad specificity phosphatase PhoE